MDEMWPRAYQSKRYRTLVGRQQLGEIYQLLARTFYSPWFSCTNCGSRARVLAFDHLMYMLHSPHLFARCAAWQLHQHRGSIAEWWKETHKVRNTHVPVCVCVWLQSCKLLVVCNAEHEIPAARFMLLCCVIVFVLFLLCLFQFTICHSRTLFCSVAFYVAVSHF